MKRIRINIVFAFSLITVFVGLALAALAVQSYASEVRPTRIMLWDLTGPPTGAFGSLGPIDYDDTRPGIEVSASTQTCWRTAPGTDNMATTIKKFRRVYVPADPGPVEALATFDYQLESGKYYFPPALGIPGIQITYFREDGLALPYTTGIPPGPAYVPCNQFPYSSRFSLGIATRGKTRALVISEAMIGSYSAVVCPGGTPPCYTQSSGNVSTYYLGVFDVWTGTKLWEATWPGVDTDGWSLSTGRSIVDELLGKQKGDYVRIVQQRPLSGPPQTIECKATVYDLLTGTVVQTTTFQISVPSMP